MTNKFPSQKWKVESNLAQQIKELLVKEGGIEDQEIKSEHEEWRVKLSDATITYYTSGTLFSTGTNDLAVIEIWDKISALAGSRFEAPTKEFCIGLDETGKGEVIGHTILVGALFPSSLFSEIEKLVGVADTKKKRTIEFWDETQKRLDIMRRKGLNFHIEKIPPWHIDKFNLNKIMDIIYQRILSYFVRDVEISKCRIVLDDYGIGASLIRYLRALANSGAEVKVIHRADENYLEARIASVIAKREREKVIQAIDRFNEFKLNGCSIGSGNAGDKETINWLKNWKKTKRPWPWFVKQSFSTVREINGKIEKVKKLAPPIREDIISQEFLREFKEGRFSIESLSVICPACGERSKAVLITFINRETAGLCLSCKKPIKDLNYSLRYYCGYILPDSNIIIGGLIGKDLGYSKFFEGFNVLISPVVKKECDTPGGKKEFDRLSKFAAMGRIKLQEVNSISEVKEQESLKRDERIIRDASRFNAIIITGDHTMKASAQTKNLFCLHTK